MNIESILTEWQYRLPKGYPQSSTDYDVLRTVITEMTNFSAEQAQKIVEQAQNIHSDENPNNQPEMIDTSKVKVKKQFVNGLLVFIPVYDNNRMGAFRLKQYGDDYKIFSVVLYDAYRNKGFGAKMYQYIINVLSKEGKHLYSDDKQSIDAKHVWDSLVRKGLATQTGETYVSNIQKN